MKIISLIIIIQTLLLSCVYKVKDNKKDIVVLQQQESEVQILKTQDIKPKREFFKSSIDTAFSDTIYSDQYIFYIEAINDSLYNDLYNNYHQNTKSFDIPYIIGQYGEWNDIENDRIKKVSNLVTRQEDALILKLKEEKIKLVNSHAECDIRNYYWYITFIEEAQCHLILQEHLGFMMWSNNLGKLDIPMGRRIFSNNSNRDLVFCDFFGDEVTGEWVNYFKWIELDSTNMSVKFSIPLKSGSDYKRVWGLNDPIWISQNSFICKYVIGRMVEYGYHYNHCFVKLRYKKINREHAN